VIPIKDVIPPRSTPWAALTILVLGVCEFVLERWLDAASRRSILDLAASGAALWLFADNVEDRLGRQRFVALYLLCYISAAAGAALLSDWSPLPLFLARGAVAGILGAYFVLYPRSRVLTLFPLPVELFEVPAVFFLCTFVILQLPGGVAVIGQVAAGLISGAALGLAFRRPVAW
jgi:membrane associated rhomboid family serine protease